jgi:hypothetical protein
MAQEQIKRGSLRPCESLSRSSMCKLFASWLIPFALSSISTSNNLAWSTRLGLKRSDLGINFSVIDPSKLDQKAIYHALPFYNVLKKQYCFDQGFFGYRGTYEHL